MDAGIYFPLFLVQLSSLGRGKAIFYMPADFQLPAMFRRRQPLSQKAKRRGWQGLFTRLL